MERCVVERIVPDDSNDRSAFVLRFQQSNRDGKMLCVIWVWVDSGIGFFLYCWTLKVVAQWFFETSVITV